MFLPTYIGLRYLKSKKRTYFTSFITGISILGIALSVTVLITVLSVMNGFEVSIREKIFSTAYHITAYNTSNTQLKRWKGIREQLLKTVHVLGSAPFISGQALLLKGHQNKFVMIYGVLPKFEKTVSLISTKMIRGSFNLESQKNQILLGMRLAKTLNVGVGQKLTLLVPKKSKGDLVIAPVLKELTVLGIFETKSGFDTDSALAYMHLEDMQDLYKNSEKMTGLNIKIDHLYHAPTLSTDLSSTILKKYVVTNWTDYYASLFAAINLEKNIMFFTLLLLVSIAAFNLISSLMMIVNEKKAEIAILRTLGASRTNILQIFIFQGSLIGIVGIVIGVGIGTLLSIHIGTIIDTIETVLQINFLTSHPFSNMDRIPSQLYMHDIVKVSFASFMMSFIATIYPAWQAANTLPVEGLRYK